MKLDPAYCRMFRLGKLYYRFIKGTELEVAGWTSDTLGQLLEKEGFIQILWIQPQGSDGRFGQREPRYVEKTGKALTKRALLNMLRKK